MNDHPPTQMLTDIKGLEGIRGWFSNKKSVCKVILAKILLICFEKQSYEISNGENKHSIPIPKKKTIILFYVVIGHS